MSGGSMDYLSFKVEQAEFEENTPLRKAFRKHLKLVADALHEIEWADSGDTSPGEHDEKAIMKCLGQKCEAATAMEAIAQAKELHAFFNKLFKDND